MIDGPRVGVVGAGYVGLTTAVCVAAAGLDTVAVDIDPERVRSLAAGIPVIDEPELPKLLRDGLARGTLRFTADFGELAGRDVVFVCVPTPSADDGRADLGAVRSVVDRLGEVLAPGAIVALKSTVPVGTTSAMAERLSDKGIRVVSTPEFLREGRAVHDFRHPDRLVIGTHDEAAARAVRRSYGLGAEPVLRMSPESAELAKYACNAFLAVKLSYANSLAALCARVGADIDDVTGCMGADRRIGPDFLRPGPGWGGSCLPKDTAALLHTARRHGIAFVEVDAARRTNTAQAGRIAAALRQRLGRPLAGCRITALGLTFKAATSDTRDSPALAACRQLAEDGAQVMGYDPQLPHLDPTALHHSRVTAVDDPYRAAKAAEAIVVLTEWPQFRGLDWHAIARDAPSALVLDTRNTLDPATVRAAGLGYLGNGAPRGF
ncbi:UDP-glucose/GDP-mannose dehydrogenase family protein [Mycobacterium paraense]|uniref:UDP-glucose dehydrogenase family protein n=1 Tax=Mycobacterium paraense TaxID=767916 RepID=UPI000A1520B8|nr:UDP-glucose/GDP-mannose dehydrogenase family protein [Mycobacterium paraense]MCV7444372.1 UDP-glucose/GDP-mannose dehydrogenase family protein [Mycobacterium paraense]ORW44609.1 UDP-glucose 6-dehydrogenase [Mycobacterium paraense]